MSDDNEQKTKTMDATGFDPALRDKIARDYGDDLLLADGFDNCVIGTCYTPGPGFRVVYDSDLIIKSLVERDDLSYEEAWEYFEFNTEGAYVGEKTPIFLRRFTED